MELLRKTTSDDMINIWKVNVCPNVAKTGKEILCIKHRNIDMRVCYISRAGTVA
jgi:hypothetical protein